MIDHLMYNSFFGSHSLSISNAFWVSVFVVVFWYGSLVAHESQVHKDFRFQFNLEAFCQTFYNSLFFIKLSRIVFIFCIFLFLDALYWEYRFHTLDKLYIESQLTDNVKLSLYAMDESRDIYYYTKFFSDYYLYYVFFITVFTVSWDFFINRYITTKICLKSFVEAENAKAPQQTQQPKPQFRFNEEAIRREKEILRREKEYGVKVGHIMGYDLTTNDTPPFDVREQLKKFNALIQNNALSEEDFRIQIKLEILKISKRFHQDDVNFEKYLMERRNEFINKAKTV